MKKILLIIAIGALNTMHGLLHIIQFIQSVFLATDSEQLDIVMEHPAFTAAMSIVGISSLVIGIKDFMHHRKCRG
jgi:hypothetical protein